MAPGINRWRDIMLNPCNRTVERRNTAAIRDTLEAMAKQGQVPPTETETPGGSSQLIFFEVQADAVGADSVAVKEVVYDSGTSAWSATGADYTAYDWTPSESLRVNFVTGYYGVGRIATNVAADALEILSIEGPARLIQVTLNENMGASVTKRAESTVTHFWGDTPNGRDPGPTIIVYDETNMAPSLTASSTALAVWDEKRAIYVLIAPWKGVQAPGQASIVEVDGGDAVLGCDSSVTKDNTTCLYSGHVMTVSVGGDFCAEDFTQGAPIWILDARQCHPSKRLGMNERYVAVGLGVTFDPGGDERPLFGVVDYTPALRWFRVLNDIETLASPAAEGNALRCRVHNCGGEDNPDDAPSVWAKWEDINPCTRLLSVLDQTQVLLYFPQYRNRCKPIEEQDEVEKCTSKDLSPECRQNQYILGFWNQIAERWDAMQDAESCVGKQDIAKIIVCCPGSLCDTTVPCCVFDAVKVKIWPRGASYCDPVREREPVWAICNNNQQDLPNQFCEIGPRICDSLLCEPTPGAGEEDRPVYLIQCGPCDLCDCPADDGTVYWKIKIPDPTGPCGFLDGISGSLHCWHENPFVPNPGPDSGWYGHFQVIGLTPRWLYSADVPPNDDTVWIEVSCGNSPGGPPGTILSAWDDNDFPVTPIPDTYSSGILTCRPMVVNGELQYRIRTYNYGIWAQCNNTEGITSAVLYLLDDNLQVVSAVGGAPCPSIARVVVASSNETWSDGQGHDPALNPDGCCDNTNTLCYEKIFGCDAPQIDILATMPPQNTCTPCDHPETGHYFGGCPCWGLQLAGQLYTCEAGTLGCGESPWPLINTNCCDHPGNKLCIEFQWTPNLDIG